jgi:hypothetical protein
VVDKYAYLANSAASRVYRFTEGDIIDIGQPIQRELTARLRSNPGNVNFFQYVPDRKELWLFLCETSGSGTTYILIWNLLTEQWTGEFFISLGGSGKAAVAGCTRLLGVNDRPMQFFCGNDGYVRWMDQVNMAAYIDDVLSDGTGGTAMSSVTCQSSVLSHDGSDIALRFAHVFLDNNGNDPAGNVRLGGTTGVVPLSGSIASGGIRRIGLPVQGHSHAVLVSFSDIQTTVAPAMFYGADLEGFSYGRRPAGVFES